jgi:endonuclease/exonuclease/phosphatase family metal-dependent hydrolase
MPLVVAAGGTKVSLIGSVAMSQNTTDLHSDFKVLSYNVHSCIGTDRRLDVARVAAVIAQIGADIVLLQELDVGRGRTGRTDQAREIALHLNMTSHFHPALHVEEEKYGDAILTARPSRVIRSAGLPSIGESRGALWVEVTIGGRSVNIINTHLGLRRRERSLQIAELLGERWLDHPACQVGPTIFGGDLNAIPGSAVISALRKEMKDGRRPTRPTFPSCFPFLRLDHLFCKGSVTYADELVLFSASTRAASDHLPLVGTFRFGYNLRR